jgi:hypothetical protein
MQGIILDEELAFLRTLEKGIKEFNSKTTSLGVGAVVPKELAFLLYDSCGFPLDLTQVMAEERGWTVDLDGFQQLMNEQKERSRKKSSGSGDKIILQAEQTDFIAKTISASPTDDSAKYSWVSMGTGKPIKAKVLAVWTGKEFKASATDSDGTVGVLLDRTNFYAEEGGQEFDTGAFSTSDASFDVNDTQKFGPYVLHIGTANGTVAVGAEVECSPDFIRRHKLAANHTMTHVRLLLLLLLFLFFLASAAAHVFIRSSTLRYAPMLAPTAIRRAAKSPLLSSVSISPTPTLSLTSKSKRSKIKSVPLFLTEPSFTSALAAWLMPVASALFARFSARSTLIPFELSLLALTSMRCWLNQTLTNGTQFLLSSAEART